MTTQTKAAMGAAANNVPRQPGLLRPALTIFVGLAVVTGLLYPGAVTGIARAVFPHEAAGSLIEKDGKVVGSALIGQPFSEPKYFWGRLSATAPMPYNAAASVGSNLGPSNPALTDAARARIEALQAADPNNKAPVPVDLVTSSGSGLDPQISVEAAQWQAPRIAAARGLPLAQVNKLIDDNTSSPLIGYLGPDVVNVLGLNQALDELKTH